MSEKIQVEISKDDIDMLKTELKCIETLSNYAETINHQKYLEKIAGEIRHFLKNIGQL